jgi:hypothetical protein
MRRRGREEPQDGSAVPSCRSGLADQRHGLSLADVERDVLDGVRDLAAAVKPTERSRR